MCHVMLFDDRWHVLLLRQFLPYTYSLWHIWQNYDFNRHIFKRIETYIFRIVNTYSFCRKRWTSQIQDILLKMTCLSPLERG